MDVDRSKSGGGGLMGGVVGCRESVCEKVEGDGRSCGVIVYNVLNNIFVVTKKKKTYFCRCLLWLITY